MPTGFAGTSQGVAAIPGFCQGVWPKAQTNFGLYDVFNDVTVFPGVEVIDQLGALIAEEPGVFELGRAFHGYQRY
jgi:hypothetical protein